MDNVPCERERERERKRERLLLLLLSRILKQQTIHRIGHDSYNLLMLRFSLFYFVCVCLCVCVCVCVFT